MVKLASAQFMAKPVKTFTLHFCERQGQVQFTCGREDIVDILQLHDGAPAWSKIASGHAFAMLLQDDAIGKATLERLAQFRRITAAFFHQEHCLSHDPDHGRHNRLVGKLGKLAKAARSDQNRTPHRFEHRLCQGEGIRVATSHDGKGSRFRCSRSARNRRINLCNSHLRQA